MSITLTGGSQMIRPVGAISQHFLGVCAVSGRAGFDEQIQPPDAVLRDQNVHFRRKIATSEKVPISLVVAMCRPLTLHMLRKPVGRQDKTTGSWYFIVVYSRPWIAEGRNGMPPASPVDRSPCGTNLSWSLNTAGCGWRCACSISTMPGDNPSRMKTHFRGIGWLLQRESCKQASRAFASVNSSGGLNEMFDWTWKAQSLELHDVHGAHFGWLPVRRSGAWA